MFDNVFEKLKAIMMASAESLEVTIDEPGHYSVDTFHTMKNGKRLWFGGVRTNKNYVSYHLMPVYVNPDLLEAISAPLRQRMQGKSCFNFRVVDDVLFRELAELSTQGLRDYQARGYLTHCADE